MSVTPPEKDKRSIFFFVDFLLKEQLSLDVVMKEYAINLMHF